MSIINLVCDNLFSPIMTLLQQLLLKSIFLSIFIIIFKCFQGYGDKRLVCPRAFFHLFPNKSMEFERSEIF